MTYRPLLLATPLAVVLLGLSPCPTAHADWRSDEAYLKRLQNRVTELRRAVALFERHRRALELVEAEVASVQLGLADPRFRPDRLIRDLLHRSYPAVKIKMEALHTKAPAGVGVWTWRCKLRGPLGELRWATQLLRQKGLFIIPSAKEPVQLSPTVDQRSGTLAFIGHHVRLKSLKASELPPEERGSDSIATRTDPLARRIRQMQREVRRLRARVADIQGFETRINAIRRYIALLKQLTARARDPFLAITPLLDLELLRLTSIKHIGKSVKLHGRFLSPSALAAARWWLVRQSRHAGVRYALAAKPRPLYAPPSPRPLPLAQAATGGPHCSVHASAARPEDLGLAATRPHSAVVVLHGTGESTGQAVSGRTPAGPCARAMAGVLQSLGMRLVRTTGGVLLLSETAAKSARHALRRGKSRKRGRRLTLRLLRAPFRKALGLLGARVPGSLRAPVSAAESSTAVSLLGSAEPTVWIRLLGASKGLALVGPPHGLRLTRDAGQEGEARKVAAPGVPPASPAPAAPIQGLSQLRLRLLVLGGKRRNRAVVSDSSGKSYLVKRGDILGRNRSQVVGIGADGVTLLWSSSRVTARVVLPPAEPLEQAHK